VLEPDAIGTMAGQNPSNRLALRKENLRQSAVIDDLLD
jgi:hypothetical protein